MSTSTLTGIEPYPVTELDTVEWREPSGLDPRGTLDLVGDADVIPAALVLAGLPVGGPAVGAAWPQDEIAARTACPTHRGVLRQSSRGSLADRPVLPRLVRGLDLRAVPVLALHGADDAVSPLPAVLDLYRGAGVPDVHVVAGGRHDILNDVTHRSVAATLVLFLERLRLDHDLAPLVVATSTARARR